ncbi:MAG: cytochrome ubiquinol oxidase subunit I, partial [Gillisia sp.]
FQVMVGIGTLLMLSGILYLLSLKWTHWRKKKLFWQFFTVLTPLGFIALEAGWVVTEVGRQPWIIYKIMKTSEAVTPMPGMNFSFYMYVMVYLLLGITITWLMWRQIKVLNSSKDAI